MKKILYEIDGKIVEIEVTDDVAKAYEEIETETQREEWRNDWRRRKCHCSLECITEHGYQLADKSTDVETEIICKEQIQELRNAIKQLLPEQQELIYRIYFKGETHKQIANALGIDRTSVSHRIMRALAALKKILKKY